MSSQNCSVLKAVCVREYKWEREKRRKREKEREIVKERKRI